MSTSMYSSSVTHTFGNVACVAIDYMKSFFPKDYFKTVHMSTKMAHRQLNVFRSKKEFWKNDKPMLIMRPRIDMDDSSKFLYGSAYTNRMYGSKIAYEYAHTVKLLEDTGYGTMIRFQWNRMKMYYDISIVVGSYNEQLNVAHMLINNLVPNTPFPIVTNLESYIPRLLMEKAGDHLKVSREDTAELLFYMNTYSEVPITYKFKNGSGNNEYFMMYPTNIEAITSDISLDDGEGRGLIKDLYTISVSLSTEFYAVGNWYLFLMDGMNRYDVMPMDEELSDPTIDQNRVIPIHSFPVHYDLHLDPGWVVFNDMSPMYTIRQPVPKGQCDKTDLKQVIRKSIQDVIKHQLGMNIPLDTLIRFKCFKNNKELIYGKHGYEIDLNEYVIKTYDCDPTATYRLFILVNKFAINATISEITKFNEQK